MQKTTSSVLRDNEDKHEAQGESVIDDNYIPKLQSKVEKTDLFNSKKKGQKCLRVDLTDRYLALSEEDADRALACLERCDGETSLGQMLAWIDDEQKRDKARYVLLRLASMGAFQIEETASPSEVKAMSKELFSWNVSRYDKGFKKAYWPVLLPTYIAVAVSAIYIIYTAFTSGLTFDYHLRNLRGGVFFVVVYYLATVFFVISHEFLHSLFASHYGLHPRRIVVVLYFYVFPTFYVKIPGLYAISERKRATILLAGVWSNFMWAEILYALYLATGWEVLAIFVLVNIQLVVNNLIPSSLTDGYFVLTTFIKEKNLRFNFLRKVASLGTKKFKEEKLTKIETIYSFSCLIFIAVFAWLQSTIIEQLFQIPADYHSVFVIGFLIVAMLFYLTMIKFRYRFMIRKKKSA